MSYLQEGYSAALGDLSEVIGVTRERVRQIEQRALAKLKSFMTDGPKPAKPELTAAQLARREYHRKRRAGTPAPQRTGVVCMIRDALAAAGPAGISRDEICAVVGKQHNRPPESVRPTVRSQLCRLGAHRVEGDGPARYTLAAPHK